MTASWGVEHRHRGRRLAIGLVSVAPRSLAATTTRSGVACLRRWSRLAVASSCRPARRVRTTPRGTRRLVVTAAGFAAGSGVAGRCAQLPSAPEPLAAILGAALVAASVASSVAAPLRGSRPVTLPRQHARHRLARSPLLQPVSVQHRRRAARRWTRPSSRPFATTLGVWTRSAVQAASSTRRRRAMCRSARGTSAFDHAYLAPARPTGRTPYERHLEALREIAGD